VISCVAFVMLERMIQQNRCFLKVNISGSAVYCMKCCASSVTKLMTDATSCLLLAAR